MPIETLTLGRQYKQFMYKVTQYSLLLCSLPIKPIRPASRVTRSGLPTSEADDFIREEGRATYTHTRLISESSATLTIWLQPGITQWASS